MQEIDDTPADTPVPPGGRHFAGDMDTSELLVSATRCLVSAPVTDAVRSPSSRAPLGMLMTMFDLGASNPAMVACRPDWTATQDLAMHTSAPVVEGPLLVDCRLVRVGKKVVIVGARAYDGHGLDDLGAAVAVLDGAAPPGGGARPTPAASGLLTFARIPGSAAPGMDRYNPADWMGQVRRHHSDTPPTGTMYGRMGLEIVDPPAGRVEMERTPYVTNSIGTILGGAQAVMMEAAAEAVRPGMVAADMEMHFLSQVKAGPARTTAEVLRDGTDHSVVEVALVDAGHADQLLALATVTLTAGPPLPFG